MLKQRLTALAAALMVPAALALTAPATGQQKITIGVSLAQDDNPFYIAMLRGVRARAQELGWDVATVSANEDKLKQINGVQDLVARGVSGILISPIDAVGVNAAYDAAAAAKIPIVSVARGSASPNQTIHVAMDEKQIGRDIAEWTAQRLGGKGKVALLMGPSGSPTFRNLGDGYAAGMAKLRGPLVLGFSGFVALFLLIALRVPIGVAMIFPCRNVPPGTLRHSSTCCS